MRPLLKFCGNHSEADLRVTSQSSADYIGFVFAKSKRQVTPEQVKAWLDRLERKPTQRLVAVFVNASVAEIVETVETIPISVIQLHGTESPEVALRIKRATSRSIWKVIHHHDNALQVMKTYEGIVDGYVVDCKVGNEWGGTGTSFDWRFVPAYLEEGKRQGLPVFIAGGINPENVGRLLRYRPDGIDISSGIECDGRKSVARIQQLEERMNDDVNECSR